MSLLHNTTNTGLLSRDWRHWMWFAALQRHWLLHHPLWWRSGLLWLPGFALAMALGFAALTAWQPLDAMTLPVEPVPSAWGFLVFAVAWPAYLIWALWPRDRHPLGTRGWRDHGVTLVLTYLGSLVLVLPLCLYDGIFSHRVAALAPPEQAQRAFALLDRMIDLRCGKRSVQSENTLLQHANEALAAPLGPYFVSVPAKACSGPDPNALIEFRVSSLQGEEVSLVQMHTSVQRIVYEHAQGSGAGPHALNAFVQGFLNRQWGCAGFTLLVLALDLWAQRVQRRGLSLGLVARLVARWGAARRGLARAGRWCAPGRRLLAHPAWWAAQGRTLVVGWALLMGLLYGQLWFQSAATTPIQLTTHIQLNACIILSGMLLVPLALWHWHRAARRWVLPAAPRAAWRVYLSAVGLACTACAVLSLAIPLLCFKAGGAVLSGSWLEISMGSVLLVTHLVVAAGLLQAARGGWMVVTASATWMAASIVAFSLPSLGALVLVPAWAFVALWVWHDMRTARLASKPTRLVLALVQISSTPVVITSVLAAAHHLLWPAQAAPSMLGGFNGFSVLLLAAAQVLALGWLMAPAMDALLQARDEPV